MHQSDQVTPDILGILATVVLFCLFLRFHASCEDVVWVGSFYCERWPAEFDDDDDHNDDDDDDNDNNDDNDDDEHDDDAGDSGVVCPSLLQLKFPCEFGL